MTIPKKQLKITKLFRRGVTKLPEDCDELQEEIDLLQQKLREKQNELFQIQRNHYRHKLSPPKKKNDIFMRPQKIILQNSIESIKRSMELNAMLTGTEVQSYIADDHCSVLFHMQHASEHEVKHGLKIDLKDGANEISASSLPLGFNLGAVLEQYDHVMKPECLGAVRRALVAYYDRLEQFQALKKLLNIEAEMFKTLDGSHMEITIFLQNITDEEEGQFKLVLLLDYEVYDIRPRNYAIRELDLPEGAADIILEKCVAFKRLLLTKAFTEVFIDGFGPYKMVQQIGPRLSEQQRRNKKRFRPNKHYYNNDDTFRPEECSDQSDDAGDE